MQLKSSRLNAPPYPRNCFKLSLTDCEASTSISFLPSSGYGRLVRLSLLPSFTISAPYLQSRTPSPSTKNQELGLRTNTNLSFTMHCFNPIVMHTRSHLKRTADNSDNNNKKPTYQTPNINGPVPQLHPLISPAQGY